MSGVTVQRRTGWVPVLVALAIVAAACGGDDDTADDPGGSAAEATEEPGDEASSDEPTDEPTDEPAEEPTDGAAENGATHELVVGATADPWIDASEADKKRAPNYPLNTDVCETLVQLGTDFSVQDSTATVDYVGDNTFRFTLNEGVTFADGTPVTVEDLKYSIDYTTTEPAIGFSFVGPDSTTIVDDRSIDVRPTEQNLRLPEQITHPTYSVLKQGSDPYSDLEGSMCTGPFVLESYTPQEEIVVVRNENYWGTPALLDRITFRFYPDDTTRSLALQNGEVDMIVDVPLAILESVESLPGIKIERAPVGNTTLMYLARRNADGSDRVLADPLVRRAVAAAIDRETYVNGVLAGNAEVIPHVAPPAVLGEFSDMVEGVPYDPAAAAQLLDDAGWTRASDDAVRTKDGAPLQVTIIYDRTDLTTAEFVQAQLRDVGFDAEVLQLDAGAYRERLDTGDYDIDISIPNQNDANPAFLMALRWYSKATGANAQIISPGPDTAYEAIIDEILAESDPTELRRLAAEAMHELVDVEVGGVTLAGGYRVYALDESVEGFQPHPSNTNQRWSTVHVEG